MGSTEYSVDTAVVAAAVAGDLAVQFHTDVQVTTLATVAWWPGSGAAAEDAATYVQVSTRGASDPGLEARVRVHLRRTKSPAYITTPAALRLVIAAEHEPPSGTTSPIFEAVAATRMNAEASGERMRATRTTIATHSCETGPGPTATTERLDYAWYDGLPVDVIEGALRHLEPATTLMFERTLTDAGTARALVDGIDVTDQAAVNQYPMAADTHRDQLADVLCSLAEFPASVTDVYARLGPVGLTELTTGPAPASAPT